METGESQHLDQHPSGDDHSLHDLEKDYHHDHPISWWLALVGPVLITALLLGLVYAFQGSEVAYSYIAASFAAFFAFGRFIILLGENDI